MPTRASSGSIRDNALLGKLRDDRSRVAGQPKVRGDRVGGGDGIGGRLVAADGDPPVVPS